MVKVSQSQFLASLPTGVAQGRIVVVLDDVANSGVDSKRPQPACSEPTVVMGKAQANTEPRT